MKATTISLDNARQANLVYFVANAAVYRRDGRCLILERHKREKVHPGKYVLPGGKLRWKDIPLRQSTRNGSVMGALLRRETKEEAGIWISKEYTYINDSPFIRPDGVPVVFQRFAVRYKGGRVKLEKRSFTNYAWVNAKEAKGYDCIPGVAGAIKWTIKHFAKQKRIRSSLGSGQKPRARP